MSSSLPASAEPGRTFGRVAEALHATAGPDIRALADTLARELESAWGTTPRVTILAEPARVEI